MNIETMVALQTAASAAFIQQLKTLGANELPFGADLLPRKVWAPCMVAALIAVGAVESAEQAEKILLVLDSELGNSSQFGAWLKKKGHIKVQEAKAAAFDFAALLKAKAEAKG